MFSTVGQLRATPVVTLLAYTALLCWCVVTSGECATMTSAAGINYDFQPYNFVALPQMRRVKRGATLSELTSSEELPMEESGTLPPDVESENKTETTEHTYYKKTVYTNRPDLMSQYYMDMVNFTKLVNGTLRHEHLNGTYRKAAGVKLGFPFPFYGHRLLNFTIATGGFLYVGDQAHNWLAATQYIAPLMANFDTMGEGAAIMYGDDGARVIVEWSNVTLRDHREAGNFSFQVSLFKNGDIWFVYKDVPISPKNISDHNHPCKLGISDAYLFNHKIPTTDKSSTNKRIIHEYHRIAVEAEKVTSNTIVLLTALPTCLGFTNCGDCSRANLTSFKCSWCESKGSPEKSFCSDDAGLNRRRQDFVDGCANEQRDSYCPVNATASAADASTSQPPKQPQSPPSTTTTPAPSADVLPQHPEGVIPLEEKDKNKLLPAGRDEVGEKAGSNWLAFFTLFIVMGVALSLWMLYAYFNPHTPSGQFLIKYRPSKWQLPSGHVRYSASVHM